MSEQQIGIHVFGRSPGYNSSDDTIVRATARHLRQRLELYYSGEGADDSVRIESPRGGYVATFEEMTRKALIEAPSASHHPPTCQNEATLHWNAPPSGSAS